MEKVGSILSHSTYLLILFISCFIRCWYWREIEIQKSRCWKEIREGK